MNLDRYLKSPGAPKLAELARRVGVSDAQMRQWRHNYDGRQPSPENCVAIERETQGRVRRWDLRPKDWHLIWPELVGEKGAPRVPKNAGRGT